MPVKSQAQREFLNWKFGHEWVKKHHFGQKGKLPMHKHKKMSDPSQTINFEEIPAVGKSLERLRGLMKKPVSDLGGGPGGRVFPSSWTPKQVSSSRQTLGRIAARADAEEHAGSGALGSPEKFRPRITKYVSPMFNASSKLIRLANIDNNLDSIVRFAYDDEDQGHPLLKAGAAAGVGTAGLYGYGLTRRGVDPGKFGGGLYRAAGQDIRNIGSAMGEGRLPTAAVSDIGKSIAAGGRGVAAGAKLGWGKLMGLVGKLRGLSSKESLIRFAYVDPEDAKAQKTVEPILQPVNVPNTKIIQEQFPAGKSPGYERDPTAEILKLPFPELMRLLKQRNILQQQFPCFSAKVYRLIKLDSRLDGILQFADLTGKPNWKGQSPETNLRRGVGMGFLAGGPYGAVGGGIAASAYGKRGVIYKKRDPLGHTAEGVVGSAALGGAGMLAGGAIGGEKGALIGKAIGSIGGFAGGYGLGARHTLLKRQAELRQGRNFSRIERLVKLDSSLDDIVEFKFPEEAKEKWEESKEKFKGAKEKLKAKFGKKKGHRSHGGGT